MYDETIYFAVDSSISRKALLIAVLLLSFLSFSPATSLAAAPSDSFLLSNGLRVVFKRDASSPLAALQIWVEAGAADEAAEEAGIAHVLEHVLFRGSSERGTGKFAGEVENLGGRMNGFTSHDRTVYHMVLPAIHAKSGLGLLAR